MTEERDKGHSQIEETAPKDFNDTANSNPTSPVSNLPADTSDAAEHSQNSVGTAPETSQPRLSRLRKKRKSSSAHLQTIGLIAAIMTIPLAYWQGRMQSSYSEFEKNQRVVELSLNLASFWETQLDPDTRYRAGRFVNKLNSFNTEEEKRILANSLLESKNLVDSNSVRQDKFLYELIEPDLSLDGPDGSKMSPVMAVARYKYAIMRALNTMEAIAIVREHSEDEAVKVIDRAYAGAVQQTYKGLIPFIEVYRERNKDGRGTSAPAWEPLTRMVKDEDRKLPLR